MARLNEPPSSCETVDALKRRFVRQNREIAKVNSTQSLKIRTLESEISRLLSENIALRERAIRLQYEIDKGSSNSILKDVGSLKGRLETKLAELGELVHELSKIQLESRRSPRPKSASKNSPKRSPDQKNWKNTFTLSEVTGGVDGRLPPILEDKYFPRKTLDAEELSGALFNTANSNDSPELGPPPIAHFEEGDPVKFDPNGISEVFTSSRNPQPPMFANLESRKKRRETSNLTQTMLEENASHPPQSSKFTDTSLSTEQPFKSSAKRKLNAREDDFKNAPLVDSDIDGGLSSRKALDSTKSSELRQDSVKLGSPARRKVSQGLDEFDVLKEQESSNKSRRALSSKSVNLDPKSPAKHNRVSSKDKILDPKDNLAEKVVGPNRHGGRPPKKHISAIKPVDFVGTTEPAKVPPETPGPPSIDIFSPTASEPSAVRPDSRDTPPPSDLKPDTAHVATFGDAGRTTRRPRSSVSYTEPNLRHKMRRPTKDLVDAVGTDERAQQVSIKQIEDANLSQEEKTYRTIVVKTEEIVKSVDPWKISSVKEAQYQHPHFREEAVSPLGNKTSTDLSTSIFTERRRHSNSLQHDDENTNNLAKPPSGARSTIAALARSQKPKFHNEGTKLPDEPELQDIFELNQSSPIEPGPVAHDGNRDPSAVVKSRRYSTFPAEEHKKEKRSTSSTVVAKREKKRETLLNGTVGTTSTVADANMDANNKPVSELRSVKSVVKMQGGLDGAAGRAERVASRRRSMML